MNERGPPPVSERARHELLSRVLNDALDRPAHERAAFVERACHGDRELAASVLSLLDQDEVTLAIDVPDGGAIFGDGGKQVAVEATTRDEAVGVSGADAIPGYRLLGPIGRGGMGTVYEAEQLNPRRRVAVKVLRPFAMTDSAHGRFQREAHLLARLQHPNVCQVLEVGRSPADRPFLVMEFVKGRTLLEHVDEAGLDRGERLALFLQACRAVGHAHERGVIHRDLKPDNVLVDEDGQPKIVDFGVAKALDGAPGESLYTETGSVFGTLGYMSPEQAAGDRVDSPTTDVYALGMLGFELLTGRAALDLGGLSLRQSLHVLQDADLSLIGRDVPSLQGDLEKILGKALDPDPSRRYPNATELADDLQRHLDHVPVVARRPSVSYRVRKFARRNRTMVVAVALVFLSLAAGLTVAVRQAIRASERADAAERLSYRTLASMAMSASEGRGLAGLATRASELRGEHAGWEAEFVLNAMRHELGETVVPGPFRSAAFSDDGRWAYTLVKEGDHHVLVQFSVPDFSSRRDFPLTGPELRVPRGALPLALTCLYMLDMPSAMLDVVDADTGEVIETLRPCDPEEHGTRQTYHAASWPGRSSFHGPSGRHLCDLRTGRNLGPRPHGTQYRRFSADGRYLSAVTGAGEARVTRMADGELIFDGGDVKVLSAAIAPDGRTLHALEAGTPRHATRWDVATGEVLTRHPLKGLGGSSAYWSLSDDRIVAMDARGRRLLIFDAELDLSFTRSLPGGTVGHQPVAVHPRGDLILAPIWERGLVTWDLRELPAHERLRAHDSYVYDAAYSPSGDVVASVGWDGRLLFWDAASRTRRLEVDLPHPYGRRVAWNRDGTAVAVVYSRHVSVLDAATGVTKLTVSGERVSPRIEPAEVIAFDPTRDVLAIGGLAFDGETLSLFNLADGSRRSLDGTGPIAWSRSGRHLATGVDGEQVRLRDGRTHAPAWTTDAPDAGVVERLHFSPDEKRLAVVRASGVQVLDVADGRVLRTLGGGWPTILAAAWTEDGARLVLGRYDGSIQFWDVEQDGLVAATTRHEGYVHALDFSPDGRTLVTASGDGHLGFWSAGPER